NRSVVLALAVHNGQAAVDLPALGDLAGNTELNTLHFLLTVQWIVGTTVCNVVFNGVERGRSRRELAAKPIPLHAHFIVVNPHGIRVSDKSGKTVAVCARGIRIGEERAMRQIARPIRRVNAAFLYRLVHHANVAADGYAGVAVVADYPGNSLATELGIPVVDTHATHHLPMPRQLNRVVQIV